jgi:hypothetical protein
MIENPVDKKNDIKKVTWTQHWEQHSISFDAFMKARAERR